MGIVAPRRMRRGALFIHFDLAIHSPMSAVPGTAATLPSDDLRRAASRRRFPLSPLGIARQLARYGNLIRVLTRTQSLGRYKGTLLGPLWSVLTPLALLFAFSFVFGRVCNANWDGAEGALSYTLPLYVSLVTFFFFAEVVSNGPTIVVSNRNFVTQMAFPLEVLPLVRTLSTALRALPNYGIIAICLLVSLGRIPPTFCLLPVVLLPMFLFALGLAYLLSAGGVFVRDLAQPIGVLVRTTLYLSAVFYPISKLSGVARAFAEFNPIARIMEDTRAVAVFGQWPGAWPLLATLGGGAAFAWLGYVVFMSLRGRFADVI